MADLKTQLEIGVDGSTVIPEVEKIKQSIAGLGGAAQAAGEKGGAAFDLLGSAAEESVRKANAATKRLVADAQRSFALLQAGASPGPRQSGQFLLTRAGQTGADAEIVKRYAAALDEVIAKNAQAAQTSQKVAQAFDYTARSAKQTTAALRQVPAQLTDIIVSLQGGQAPLTVLLQQGGQLKDIFGGIGPAARALGGYLLQLVNPYTALAGAVVALGAAYYRTTRQQDEFAKSLIFSGNAIGTTVDKLSQTATRVSESLGTSFGTAAEAVTAFAADGNVAAKDLEKITEAAIRLERAGGQSVAETIKQFAELKRDPVEAASRLNEKLRFLTATTADQIKASADLGRSAEAAAAAQAALFDALDQRGRAAEARLGNLEIAWRKFKDAALGGLDALAGAAFPNSASLAQKARDELRILEELDAKVRSQGKVPTEDFTKNLEARRAIVAQLDEQDKKQQAIADGQAQEAERGKTRLRTQQLENQYIKDKETLLKRALSVIDEQIKKEEQLNPGQNFSALRARLEAGAREQFTTKTPKGPRDPQRGIDRSDLNFDLSQIKAEQDRLVSVYADAERILESLRSGGLVNEKEYYEARRKFIALDEQARTDAFQKEVARLEQERAIISGRKTQDQQDAAQQQKDLIDNDRKIAEARANLSRVQEQASNKNTLSLLEEGNAARSLAKSYEEAALSQQQYLNTQNTQQARAIASAGLGDQARGRIGGINQIEDRFNEQRQRLEQDRLLLGSKMTADEYQKRLAIINEFQQKSLASFNSYYDQLIALQRDSAVGANEAVNNYIDNARNAANSTQEFLTNAFQGLEDSLTKFLTTGKLGFKEFANSIVLDITRIIVKQQIANALAGAMGFAKDGGFGAVGNIFQSLMGGSLGGTQSSGAFGIGVFGAAMGGSVERGQIVEVNETGKGPGELFSVGDRQYLLAAQGGQIKPTKPASGGDTRGVTVVNNFTVAGSVDRRTQSQIAAAAGQGVQRALVRNS